MSFNDFDEYRQKQEATISQLDGLKEQIKDADAQLEEANAARDAAYAPFKETILRALSDKVFTPEYFQGLGLALPSKWKSAIKDAEPIAPQGDELYSYINELLQDLAAQRESLMQADSDVEFATETRNNVSAEYKKLVKEAVKEGVFPSAVLGQLGHFSSKAAKAKAIKAAAKSEETAEEFSHEDQGQAESADNGYDNYSDSEYHTY